MRKKRDGKLNDRLYRPLKSFLALAITLGLIFGISLRYLYDYKPFTSALGTDIDETVSQETLDLPDLTPTPIPENASGLTANQILQRILDAVAGNISTQEAFAAIPPAQLDGLSFEEFQRYISLIDLALKSAPTSFSPMTLSERDRQIARIVQVDPEFREIAEASTYHWLEAPITLSEVESLAIAVQRSETGMIYLNKKWVRNIIDLYDYAQTYFGTISQQNAEVLSTMIDSDSSNSTVKLAKAKSALNYYNHYRVTSQGLKIEAFDLSHIRYSVTTEFINNSTTEVEVEGTDATGVELPDRSSLGAAIEEGILPQRMTRTLQIHVDANGTFKIADAIPELTSEDDFTLAVNSNTTLTIGQEVSSVKMSNLFGKPLLTRLATGHAGISDVDIFERSQITPAQDALDQDEFLEHEYLFVRYEEIELLILDPVVDAESGEGQGTLVGFTFINPFYKTSRGIGPEMTIDELLLTYNFIDQTKYTLENAALERYITFQEAKKKESSDELIGAIRVGRLDELNLDLFAAGDAFGIESIDQEDPESVDSWQRIGDKSNMLPVVNIPEWR